MFRREDEPTQEQVVQAMQEQAEATRAAEEMPRTISELIENPLEFAKWTADPEARQKYEHLNKDLVLSNLTQKDIDVIKEHLDLARELKDASMTTLASEHIEMAYEVALTSQGRYGFRSKMLNRAERIVRTGQTQKKPNKGFFDKW